MMQTKKMIILIVVLIMLPCCSDNSIALIDEYRIYPQDEFGEGYYLICKLGCKGDPKIENITTVKWNNSFILVKVKNPLNHWYIIKAKGEVLKCCNNDTLIGPFSKEQMESYLDGEKVGKLKEKFLE